MGKEDVYESDYLENAEVFADLVNGVLYHGEQIVKPQELQEQDGELRSILGENVKKTIRDKVKLWNGTLLAVFAVENQTKVDYHMVIRAMLAESMAYDKQWKKRKSELDAAGKESRTGKSAADEFISGMKKGDKFIPIITIVVYYGREKPWDGAKTLYELLDIGMHGEKILPFVSNYHLNVFDYHEYESFEQFHSELQYFFEFLRYSTDKNRLAEKFEKHKERYRELSNQAKILLMKLIHIKKIPDVKEEDFEKGEFDMGNAFEDMKEEGRIEGKAEEMIAMGHEFGLSDTKILERLQNKLSISAEKAQEFFGRFGEKAVI